MVSEHINVRQECFNHWNESLIGCHLQLGWSLLLKFNRSNVVFWCPTYRFGVDHSGECWNSIVHCRLHTHVTGRDLDELAVSTVANSVYNNGGARNASHSQ